MQIYCAFFLTATFFFVFYTCANSSHVCIEILFGVGSVRSGSTTERKKKKTPSVHGQHHLKALLEDVTTFLDDIPVVTVVSQKKKEEQDKAKGLVLQKASIEMYTSKCA